MSIYVLTMNNLNLFIHILNQNILYMNDTVDDKIGEQTQQQESNDNQPEEELKIAIKEDDKPNDKHIK